MPAASGRRARLLTAMAPPVLPANGSVSATGRQRHPGGSGGEFPMAQLGQGRRRAGRFTHPFTRPSRYLRFGFGRHRSAASSSPPHTCHCLPRPPPLLLPPPSPRRLSAPRRPERRPTAAIFVEGWEGPRGGARSGEQCACAEAPRLGRRRWAGPGRWAGLTDPGGGTCGERGGACGDGGGACGGAWA